MGRITLKSLVIGENEAEDGASSQGRTSMVRWKKKSELSRKSLDKKSRISIKGANQYEYHIQDQDPFNVSRSSVLLDGNSSEERKSAMLRPSQQQFKNYYKDFAPEIDEAEVGEELDEMQKKFSIRALNFKMMSKLT